MFFSRRSKRSESPARVALLDELDRLASEGSDTAARAASEVVADGRRGAERWLAWAAGHILECSVWATLDPICRALVAYEKATTGIDLAAIPSEHERARAALTARSVNLGQAAARQDAVLARMHERASQRHLAGLRAMSGRSIEPMPPASVSMPPVPRRAILFAPAAPAAALARATRLVSAPQPKRATYRGPEQRRS